MATLSDVAKSAGVSKVVASAVVNGGRTSTRFSDATRERVLEAARQLRYVPNVAAQSLRRRGMNMLAVSFARSEFRFGSNPYFSLVMEGVCDGAAAAGFDVAIFTKPWISVEESSAPYRNGRIDGAVIVSPLLTSDMVRELDAMELPLVLVSTPADIWENSVPAVNVDNAYGVQLAVEHLLSLGHRRIGFVAGGFEHDIASSRERRESFLATMRQAGITVSEEMIRPGKFTFVGGYEAARELLSCSNPPTALFAANDHSALGALKAAADLGLSVPRDLSIAGFDDIPDAALAHPPLTTVRAPIATMGRQAADLLIARITGETVAPVTYKHKPELVVRTSTTVPRPTIV